MNKQSFPPRSGHSFSSICDSTNDGGLSADAKFQFMNVLKRFIVCIHLLLNDK